MSERKGFNLDTPFKDLAKEHQDLILYGEEGAGRWSAFEGVVPNLERRFRETESEFMKEEINKYMSVKPCTGCRGNRLKPEALAVTVNDQTIMQVTALSVEAADHFFKNQMEEFELLIDNYIKSRLVIDASKVRKVKRDRRRRRKKKNSVEVKPERNYNPVRSLSSFES